MRAAATAAWRLTRVLERGEVVDKGRKPHQGEVDHESDFSPRRNPRDVQAIALMIKDVIMREIQGRGR
jgi:hypothetical protein